MMLRTCDSGDSAPFNVNSFQAVIPYTYHPNPATNPLASLLMGPVRAAAWAISPLVSCDEVPK